MSDSQTMRQNGEQKTDTFSKEDPTKLRNEHETIKDCSGQRSGETMSSSTYFPNGHATDTLLQEAIKNSENAKREIKALKMQLQMAEETRDSSRQDLMEAHRKIRESDEANETHRKENLGLRRQLKDEELEKSSLEKRSQVLREKIKQIESERADTKRGLQELENKFRVCDETRSSLAVETNDLRSRLIEFEAERAELRREFQESLRQVKLLSSECLMGKREVSDLRQRLAQEEALREDLRYEAHTLKQNILHVDGEKEDAKQNVSKLQRRIKETEDTFGSRTKDYEAQIDELKQFEQKAKTKIREMENLLEQTTFDRENYKAQLCGNDGRISALETQLTRMEAAKNDVEYKLSSFYSIFRRLLGVKSHSRSPTPNENTPNTNRKTFRRPTRSISDDSTDDMDPDAVKSSLTELLDNLKESEIKREELLVKIDTLQKLVAQAEEQKIAQDGQLQRVNQEMTQLRDQKRLAEERVNSFENTTTLQEEAMHRIERDKDALAQKIQMLESSLDLSENERRHQQDEIAEFREAEKRLKEEKLELCAKLDNTSGNLAKNELRFKTALCELQRHKDVQHEMEAENRGLRERTGTLAKANLELENKISSLNLASEKLNSEILKGETEETRLKQKIQALSVSLSESNGSSQNLQDHIYQLQRSLESAEGDKRLQQERMRSLRETLNNCEKENRLLAEKIGFLEKAREDAELRINDFENQVKHVKSLLIQRQENEEDLLCKFQELEQERNYLQEQNSSLHKLNSSFEAEKRDLERSNLRIGKDVHALRKSLDRLQRDRLEFEESVFESSQENEILNRTLSETTKQNSELREQVDSLQRALHEVEARHVQSLQELTEKHQQESEIRAHQEAEKSQKTFEKREKLLKAKMEALERQVSGLRKEIQHEREDKKKEFSWAANRSDEIREVRHSLGKSLQAVEEDANNLRGMLGKSLRKIDRYTEAIRRNEAPPSSTNTDESEVDDFRHEEIDHSLESPKHLRLSKRRTRSATQLNLKEPLANQSGRFNTRI